MKRLLFIGIINSLAYLILIFGCQSAMKETNQAVRNTDQTTISPGHQKKPIPAATNTPEPTLLNRPVQNADITPEFTPYTMIDPSRLLFTEMQLKELAKEVIKENKKKLQRDESLLPIMLVYVSSDNTYGCSIIGAYKNGSIKDRFDFKFRDSKTNGHDYVSYLWNNYDIEGQDELPITVKEYMDYHPANNVAAGDEVVYVYSKTRFVGKAKLVTPPEIAYYGNADFLFTRLEFEDDSIKLDQYDTYIATMSKHNPLILVPEITDEWGSMKVDLDGDGKMETIEFTDEAPKSIGNGDYFDNDIYEPMKYLKITYGKQKMFFNAGMMTLEKGEHYENGWIGAFDLDNDGNMEIIADFIYYMDTSTDIVTLKNKKLEKSYQYCIFH